MISDIPIHQRNLKQSKITFLPISELPSIASSHQSTQSKPQTTIQEQLSQHLNNSKPNNLNLANISELNLPCEIIQRLYEHQVEGVQWMFALYKSKQGGILGDDMGLGKTFQLTCLLTGLMRINEIKRILILSPVSVMQSWNRELIQHLVPHVRFVSIEQISSEMSKKVRMRTLKSIFQSNHPCIVLSSYQLFTSMYEEFCSDQRIWDYVILDEGHVVKNPQTKLSKAIHAVKSRNRLILTGTPIQNHLIEFWALVNWVSSGRVLGSRNEFITRFADPILKGQDPKATDKLQELSNTAIIEFLTLIRPILLQRKKCERQDVLQLTSKVEVTVWIPLSSTQRKQYEEYIKSREVSIALKSQTTYPVQVINRLKTLCRHPLLIEATKKKAELLNKESDTIEDDIEDVDGLENAFQSMNINKSSTSSKGTIKSTKLKHDASIFDIVQREPNEFELFQGSVKLRVLVKLCHKLISNNHRILVFSQSKLMVDIMQHVLAMQGMSSSRIDGSVCAKDRQRIIDEFNNKNTNAGLYSPDICLLTTKACGYGITLTGADRVIIFDPSWNPAEDRQAVDRSYRIGQKRDVVVYRLIMASAIEEKMYEKQVFKDGLRVVTESGKSDRYFSNDETKELFTLGPKDQSLVMEKLWRSNGEKMTNFDDIETDDIPGILGFSRHDTLYQEKRPEEVKVDNSTMNKKSTHRSDGMKIFRPININSSLNHQVNLSKDIIDLTSDEDGPFSQTNETVDIHDIRESDNINEESIVNISLTSSHTSQKDNQKKEDITIFNIDDSFDSDSNIEEDNIEEDNIEDEIVEDEYEYIDDLNLFDSHPKVSSNIELNEDHINEDKITPIVTNTENSQSVVVGRLTPFLMINFSDDEEGESEEEKEEDDDMYNDPISNTSNVMPIFHPKSCLDEDETVQYELLLSQASLKESQGEYEEAGNLYVSAIGLCDEDIEIHKKLQVIGKKLEFI